MSNQLKKMDAIKNSTVFNPTSGIGYGTGSVAMATSFSEPITYYTLPETMSQKSRARIVFYIAALGTSTDIGLKRWKSWLVTYVCAVTPAVGKMLNRKTFQAVQLSSTKVLEVDTIFDALEDQLDAEDAAGVERSSKALADLNIFADFPRMKGGLNLGAANGEWTFKVVACHYSIVLFLAGKRVAGDDHSQITVARPRALKSKAHISDPVDLLEGSFKLSDVSHVKINDAWSEMGALRGVVFTEYIKFESVDTDEFQNLIWTTLHLLRFSGMSHASIVYNFLQVCPWVHEIPTLRPALASYARSIVEASKVDPRLFPYIKLIYGDKSTFFQRKDLEPLIACAVSVLTETNPTLSAYFTRPEFAPIVEAFNSKRQEKEAQLGASIKITAPTMQFEDDEEGSEASEGDDE